MTPDWRLQGQEKYLKGTVKMELGIASEAERSLVPEQLLPQLDMLQKRRDKDPMQTLTVTQARKNLSKWLRRAKAGEEIGIVDGADIIALRPVIVTAVDYMETEYQMTKKEADAAAARIVAEGEGERRNGRLIPLEASSGHVSGLSHKTRRRRA
jgi:antitoxin (DNA-binding transcriptional repressor) of toxin-antitoxin stability system